jgi:hypothetical protein
MKRLGLDTPRASGVRARADRAARSGLRRGRARRIGGVGAVLLAVLATWAAHADRAIAAPAHLRLRGSAHIDAHGARAEGEELLLRGVLQDDAASPLAHEAVTLSIARAASPAQRVGLGDDRRAPRSCATGVHDPRPNADHSLTLTTDAAGRFCVRAPLPVDRYVAHLEWPGSTLVDGAKADVPVDMSRRALTLRFEPEPRVVSVDSGAQTGATAGASVPVTPVTPVAIEAVAAIDDNGTLAAAAGLALTLTNERGALLASGRTNAAGRVRFAMDPELAGPPGRGELRVAFAGNADTASTTHVAEIERHTRVELLVPGASREGAEGGEVLPAGAPEDGVAFTVTVRARGAEVPSGSVEARVGDMRVGAASVEHGEASVVVTFAADPGATAAGDVAITLRYAPSAPWYEPGEPRVVRLPVRGASPWRQLPLVLAGLAVIAWFVLGRTARSRAANRAPPRPRPVSRGEAKVDVVRVARDPHTGWSGRIVDAHEGDPVEDAFVSIVRPAFGVADVVGRTQAGDDGRFQLVPTSEARPGDELLIEAPLHASLRRPLPPSGELDVALVLRKRALLARLVAWARQRGRPFDARPEPTPGHVRRQAGNDFNLARWAEAVERAAFAGAAVDARAEEEIDRLAPAAAPASSAAPSPPVSPPSPPSRSQLAAPAFPAPPDSAPSPPSPSSPQRRGDGTLPMRDAREGPDTPKAPKQGL